MSWSAVETALHAWVVAASGITGSLVRFAHHNEDRPAPPNHWVELTLGNLGAVGIADAIVISEVDDPDPGEEIEIRAVGHRESALAIQVHADADGDSGARAIAETIQTALQLPAIHRALDAAGVSVFDRGSITSVPRVVETDWEGRAVLSCRLYTIAQAAERTTYIETAHVELTQQAVEFDAPE